MKTPILVLATALSLPAAESSMFTGDRFTGDWNGLRTDLEERGVTWFGYYNAIFAGNFSGGRDQDSNYAGDLYTGLLFDLEKIWGWDDTVFKLSMIDRHGSSIDPEVGGQFSVMQLVGGQNTFLYEVNLEKTFLDDTLALKFGRMTATDDFCGSPFYSYALTNAINGQIRACLFDGVMTSYPFPVWGARLKYQPNDGFYAMVGAFQLADDMFDRDDQGVDFSIEDDDGLSIFTQLGWNTEICSRPAHFFVGANNAFWSMDKFNSYDRTHHFFRLYGHGDWQAYAEPVDPEQGLYVFGAFAYTWQEQVAITPLQLTCGLHYRGLIPCRPDDRTLLFVTYGKFSDDYADERVLAGNFRPEYELIVEAGHRIQVTPSSYIQPDLQYFRRPGGTGTISDAWVLGAQFGFTF